MVMYIRMHTVHLLYIYISIILLVTIQKSALMGLNWNRDNIWIVTSPRGVAQWHLCVSARM